LDKKNLWISGSRGFIGKHLQHYLKTTYDITCISHNTKFLQLPSHVNLYELNFLKRIDIEKLISKIGKPDIFIHLGWGDMVNNSSLVHLHENIESSKNLIDCFFENNIEKFVFIGSIDEYGEKNRILRENTLSQGQLTNYAKGKQIVADYGFKKSKKTTQNFLHVRLCNTYGVGQKKSSLINYLYNSAMNHETALIHSGNDFRDFIHITEVLIGIELLIKQNKSTTVNLGSGEMHMLKDFIMEFWSQLDQKTNDVHYDEDNDKSTYEIVGKVDLTLLYELTKWTPSLSLKDGIKLTIKELRELNKIQDNQTL